MTVNSYRTKTFGDQEFRPVEMSVSGSHLGSSVFVPKRERRKTFYFIEILLLFSLYYIVISCDRTSSPSGPKIKTTTVNRSTLPINYTYSESEEYRVYSFHLEWTFLTTLLILHYYKYFMEPYCGPYILRSYIRPKLRMSMTTGSVVMMTVVSIYYKPFISYHLFYRMLEWWYYVDGNIKFKGSLGKGGDEDL